LPEACEKDATSRAPAQHEIATSGSDPGDEPKTEIDADHTDEAELRCSGL
jgi:hypothetical protein